MVCGKHTSEVGPISWRGKCRPCGLQRERDAIIQLAHHNGPMFDHWRARMAASVGGVLLDDLTERT
jgi:hypothetical protein